MYKIDFPDYQSNSNKQRSSEKNVNDISPLQNSKNKMSNKQSLKIDDTNLLESLDFVASKENRRRGILNNSQSMGCFTKSRIESRQNSLIELKRSESEKLLTKFTRQLQLLQNQNNEQDVRKRVDKLQIAVGKIQNINKFLHYNSNVFDFENVNKNEVTFVVEQIVAKYQFQLEEKNQQINQLKKNLQQLQNKYNLQKSVYHDSARRYVKNYLKQSFGHTNSMRNIKNNDNLRHSFIDEVNLTPIVSRQLPKISSFKSSRHTQSKQDGCIQDYFDVVQNQNDNQPLKQNLQQINEEKDEVKSIQKGYQTGRFACNFGDNLDLIIACSPKKKYNFTCQNNLNQIILPSNQLIPPSKQSNFQKLLLKQFCTQTDNLEQNNRGRAETADTDKPQLSSSQILNKKSRQLNKKNNLKISTQYSITINAELIGKRLKNYKSLTKIVIQLLAHIRNLVSKIHKKQQTKCKLNIITTRITQFIEQFNKNYRLLKQCPKKFISEQFYYKNINQLKCIQNEVVSLLPIKIDN